MARVKLPALMIALALLCGCSNAGAAEGRLEKMRSGLNSAAAVSFKAEVRQSLGNEEFCCTLDCKADSDGMAVTVTEPESIAGIRMVSDPEGTRLEYEGVSLCVPMDAPSPAAAPIELLRALRSGHMKLSWREKYEGGELTVMSFYIDDDSELQVWSDPELTPVHAELKSGDRIILSCDIREFTLE